MKVKGKVVVVTGASSGIGRAAAAAFAGAGASVVLTARNAEALDEAVRECERAGGRAWAVPADVTDARAVDHVARRTVERFGRIDVWVNCAAVAVFGSFGEVPLADFRRVLDVNVMGYVHGARAALPYLRDRGRGVLINVSSIVSAVPPPYGHAYAMSKFAVRALSMSLRQELALEGARKIRVCTVMPATIDTPFFQHAADYTGRRPVAMPPVHAPERVARAIVNLVRVPRREVVVGSAGRLLMAQAKVLPGLTERMLAAQTDRAQLSRTEAKQDTTGNLYDPAPGRGSIDGGWHGKRRTAVRRAATVAALAGTAAGVRRALR
ncbi:SDR family oxidoreductase [Actinocorallia populi]|uniref:SDR family oxidoreductase n=1 Tax=Actinocorallia populi TaxID=2079200 RepID=UPI000D093C0A|nr:SDR family oxidoreductase [Actinocorallia populi]